MNQIPIYQHPFVDVFKLVKLTQWGVAHKEGDVQDAVWDSNLGKSIITISGISSSANYVQIPALKQLPKKSLGLTGKYIYLMINKPEGKNCVMHLDYMVNETRLAKISLSNIYKEFKNVNGGSLQIPLTAETNRWVVVCVNVYDLLQDNKLFQVGQPEKFYLRSLQICSNVSLRAIFTSDIQYQAHSLPKDFQFKVPTGSDWFSHYSWFQYPPLDFNKLEAEPEKKVAKKKTVRHAANTAEKKRPGSTLDKASEQASKGKGGSTRKKKGSPSKQSGGKSENSTKAGDNEEGSPGKKLTKEQQEELLMLEGQKQMTMEKIDELKKEYKFNIEAKNLAPKADVTLYEEQSMAKAFNRRKLKQEKFLLKPNPIMRLDRVVGWHPHSACGQVYFNRDPKLPSEILYTQANLLIGYYPPLQKQRLFYERQTNNIDQLFVENCAGDKSFAFSICKSLEENARDNEITIWSLDSFDTTNAQSTSLFTFKPPLRSINSISVSAGEEMEHICLAGKDHNGRDALYVFKFLEMIKFKNVEMVARQLSDYDQFFVRFNSLYSNSIISCGKENIKFYKIKNGHLPGQSVILNNTARNKIFHQAVAQQGKDGKIGNVFVATTCGELFFINYFTRQIEKIIKIHDSQIVSLVEAPNKSFFLTASQDGILRLWSPDFSNLKSEVNTRTPISHCDINANSNQICVLSSQAATISVLDLESSSYNVILRSHFDEITDVTHNQMTGKLVTIGNDYCVKVWDAETMDQINEFVSDNDLPVRVVAQNQGTLGEGIECDHTDSLVAIGFRSGFLRILDLDGMQIVHETLLFQSPVMDIDFSLDNKYMAVFFKSGKIVIIKKERQGEFIPVKNIDIEVANENYCSLAFSPDGSMLANISSNANTITVWETRNFSLRYHLDVTGDIISKLSFAPNGRDLLLLTTTSKLKSYRLRTDPRDKDLLHIKDSYGVTELECQDFWITSNNKFLVVCGKEGTLKVYDYFMRGTDVPSSQSFLGHFKFPRKIVLSRDMRFAFSLGELNGIFKWNFYGDATFHPDLSQYCEPVQREEDQLATLKAKEEEKEEEEGGEDGMFEHAQLAAATAEQIQNLNSQLYSGNNNLSATNNMATLDPSAMVPDKPERKVHPFQNTIDVNKGGYVLEKFKIGLQKVLACSNGIDVKNNIVWHEEERYIAYSIHNIIVIESLNQEKTQRLLKEGNDQIYQMKLSPNKRYLLAFSRRGPIDGFPCVYIFDSVTFKKLNYIAISDAQIESCEFSSYCNMLLVISTNSQGDGKMNSSVTVWDFEDGHKDIFAKSAVPVEITHSQWNPYMEKNSDEFVTISPRCYHYWRITKNLQLQFQEGELPTRESEGFRDKTDRFSCVTFVKPNQLHHSVYLLIGTASGYVWVTDTRTNQFLIKVKVLDDAAGAVTGLFSSFARIIVEAENLNELRSWDQSGKHGDKEYSQYNPFNFFLGKQEKLTIDGNCQSSFYDETGNKLMVLSTSGSIWYLSFIEGITIRLKSCHNPKKHISSLDFKYVSPSEFDIQDEQDQVYTFDQNYQVTSASSDGLIKLWNMYDLEYAQQFIVPREECLCIAMHQFKPYMICAFTDGFIRFFDLNTSKLLGRCQIHSGQEEKPEEPKKASQASRPEKEETAFVDSVIALKILPSGNHIFAATKHGQVILIFVQSWSPMSIKLHTLVTVQTSINSFDYSYLEPYNKWLVATGNGKVIVYNRKDFNSLNQEVFDEQKPPQFNFMDSFNVQDYSDNGYSQARRCNTLDHYYSMAKRNLVYNEVDPLHACEGVFVNNDLTLHLSFIRQCNQLFIRNFELHQVVKRIEMSPTAFPLTMQLMPGSSPFVCVGFTDNTIKLIDFMNEENQALTETMHEDLKSLKVCPNGRYILSGGNRGDLSLWKVEKQILGPEAILDAVKEDKQQK